MLRAAIYARYSSNLQRPTSIEDQTSLCRSASPRFGCEVAEEHIYIDAEISGATSQRPGYQALMRSAKAKQFEVILVESQDRLWRDQAEMHDALKRLRYYGVSVFPVTLGTDLTGPTGGIVAAAKGMVDEFFLRDLRDKTRRGMEGTVRRGLSAGGRAYGYRSAPVLDGANQIIGYRREVDPEQAQVLLRIWTLYADRGMSAKAIVSMLNQEGALPPRPAKGRRLRGWTVSTVIGSKKGFGLLNNPIYVGRNVWNRTQKVRNPDTGRRVMQSRRPEEWVTVEAPELRICPDDLWKRVQAVREGKRRAARGNLRGRRTKFLLSGLLVCAECGANYVIRKGSYYACSGHANRGPAICSNSRLARRDRVENAVLQAVFEEVFSPETLAYLTDKVNKALARLTVRPDAARQRLQSELDEARAKLENVKAAILEGIRTPTTKSMLDEWEQKAARLEAALALITTREKITIHPATVERYLRDLKGTLGRDTDHARTILERLIGKVILRRQKDHLVAEVGGNLPGLLNLETYWVDSFGAGRGI